MKESTHRASALSNQQRLELELLHSVLDEDVPYPWNPADPVSRDLINQYAEDFASGDLSNEDWVSQWAKPLWETAWARSANCVRSCVGMRVPNSWTSRVASGVA
jgi:hypothetical protein